MANQVAILKEAFSLYISPPFLSRQANLSLADNGLWTLTGSNPLVKEKVVRAFDPPSLRSARPRHSFEGSGDCKAPFNYPGYPWLSRHASGLNGTPSFWEERGTCCPLHCALGEEIARRMNQGPQLVLEVVAVGAVPHLTLWCSTLPPHWPVAPQELHGVHSSTND